MVPDTVLDIGKTKMKKMCYLFIKKKSDDEGGFETI